MKTRFELSLSHITIKKGKRKKHRAVQETH